MKVLPMNQPWASLVVAGAKRLETRPRATPKPLLSRVAVHANISPREIYLAATKPFSDFLPSPDALPIGAIIGAVTIVRSAEITEEIAEHTRVNRPLEFAFGGWTPGRFAWVLTDPVKFETPVPFVAHQGWPDVDPADLPELA